MNDGDPAAAKIFKKPLGGGALRLTRGEVVSGYDAKSTSMCVSVSVRVRVCARVCVCVCAWKTNRSFCFLLLFSDLFLFF